MGLQVCTGVDELKTRSIRRLWKTVHTIHSKILEYAITARILRNFASKTMEGFLEANLAKESYINIVH